MTDLLSAFVQYATSGPQEFCIAMVVPGLCVMMFGKKIEKTAKPAPKRQPKKAKRKPKTKTTTARKKSHKQKKKVVGETPKWKPFMKYEDYNAESHERINKYHSRRDGVKPETDGWQTVGGVPL